eukprot:TRINITY_DN3111_c0_g2_i3.p1 TRINITY_DN3111_c0_g2~~TRINITY_DN3111_c0_g2_i3.p1  ORF type:complete len:1229 (-),score=178.22 TRINITY_DN3111_c0_g2_i3:135-3821(-)
MDEPLCKGIESNPNGRCEVWTRSQGIQASVEAAGFTCLTYGSADPFQPVDGGSDRACRGSSASDNLASYYSLSAAGSLDECKRSCSQTSGCKGIEFKEGRCEVWVRPAGIGSSVPLPGYTCLRYTPDHSSLPPSGVQATFDGQTYNACLGTAVHVTWNGFHNLQEMSSAECNSLEIGDPIYNWQQKGHEHTFEAGELNAAPGSTRYFKCTAHCNQGIGFFAITCPDPNSPASPSDSTFEPIDGGSGRACRGSSASDNLASYYTVSAVGSLDECKRSCVQTSGCKGVEFKEGRCEVWVRPAGIGSSIAVPDYTCLRYTSEGFSPSTTTSRVQPSSETTTSPEVSAEWTSHPGVNCYAGNGAGGIYGKDPLNGDLSEEDCKNECLLEPSCDGIVMPRGDARRTCWLRKNTRLGDCLTETTYDYWARPDGALPPSPPWQPVTPAPSPIPAPTRPPLSTNCPVVQAACSRPSGQDWTITQSCTLQEGRYSFRKLAILDGAVVNVMQGATVFIDLTGGLFVGDRSELWIGCEAVPFAGSLTATFKGNYGDDGNSDMGFRVNYEDHGLPKRTETWHNGLIVGHGARLEIHGQQKTSWARLQESATAGSSSLMLDRTPREWTAGDEIIVTSTSQSKEETETAMISGVNGNVITLSASLRHDHVGHWAGRGIRLNAEVGMLTRNIKFTSDVNEQACDEAFTESPPGDNAKSRCFGGQLAFLQHSVVHVENSEFSKLGQGLHMGRYALHFHLAGDASGSYLRDNSVHHGFNRCITLHGTFNAVLDGNVCFENRGHNIYLEDGIETGNQILSNLVVNPRRSATVCSDWTDLDWVRKPSQAGIWITNPNNTFMGNTVVGAQFGVWFTFPPCEGEPYSDDRGTCGGAFGGSRAYFMDVASGFGPTSWVNKQEQSRTPTTFHNNSIKGSQRTGLFIDGKIIDSEDPRIPCLENAGQWEHTECGTCPLVGHTFKWGPMDFDVNTEPSRRSYRPVKNVFNDIVVAYNAGGQGGFGADDFSFWASGGAISFDRAIFAYNRQGASVVGPGDQCASHVVFGASGYTAQYRNSLFLGEKGSDRGAPAFRYYDGGFHVVNSRWVGLDYLVEMREASGGNTNGLLMTDSAPLGWFDSDSEDELYKWLFDSGRAELLPRASTVADLADWRSDNIDRPENVHLITTNGFGDHLQLGFRQFVYDRASDDIGWGPHVRVEQGATQCRQFYTCRWGWCGTGADCSSYEECSRQS